MLGGFPSYISAQQHRVFFTMLLSEEQVLNSVQTWGDGSPLPVELLSQFHRNG